MAPCRECWAARASSFSELVRASDRLMATGVPNLRRYEREASGLPNRQALRLDRFPGPTAVDPAGLPARLQSLMLHISEQTAHRLVVSREHRSELPAHRQL